MFLVISNLREKSCSDERSMDYWMDGWSVRFHVYANILVDMLILYKSRYNMTSVRNLIFGWNTKFNEDIFTCVNRMIIKHLSAYQKHKHEYKFFLRKLRELEVRSGLFFVFVSLDLVSVLWLLQRLSSMPCPLPI